ncbi:MAG: hypothetical protein IPG17_05910 [Sandaracinaceae bacterium]|jgi:hypothetical protein|nr:hypothetical protein [Sandaracinaceae bacterium]MBP7682706.1 hypothetical protein [Deltaproteobacteria bacterium]MBK6807704.1 hypothetical protein [Sandaracinaceae bacterium]MBK7155173.1 hypothetical protein [Sandaracinaceae bacterium]MBK7776221.1 hypothetical protein [Sandaracinaceae bacterium]
MMPGRFPPGSDVFAPWGDDPWLYPAVVLGVDPKTQVAFVVYWEGNTAGVHDNTLRPMNLAPGMRVTANVLNDNVYLPGVVQARYGGAVNLATDDGRSLWCTWAKCRVPR